MLADSREYPLPHSPLPPQSPPMHAQRVHINAQPTMLQLIWQLRADTSHQTNQQRHGICVLSTVQDFKFPRKPKSSVTQAMAAPAPSQAMADGDLPASEVLPAKDVLPPTDVSAEFIEACDRQFRVLTLEGSVSPEAVAQQGMQCVCVWWEGGGARPMPQLPMLVDHWLPLDYTPMDTLVPLRLTRTQPHAVQSTELPKAFFEHTLDDARTLMRDIKAQRYVFRQYDTRGHALLPLWLTVIAIAHG